MQVIGIISCPENSVVIQLSPYGCVWASWVLVYQEIQNNSYYLKSERMETSFDVREEYIKHHNHGNTGIITAAHIILFMFELQLMLCLERFYQAGGIPSYD